MILPDAETKDTQNKVYLKKIKWIIKFHFIKYFKKQLDISQF